MLARSAKQCAGCDERSPEGRWRLGHQSQGTLQNVLHAYIHLVLGFPSFGSNLQNPASRLQYRFRSTSKDPKQIEHAQSSGVQVGGPIELQRGGDGGWCLTCLADASFFRASFLATYGCCRDDLLFKDSTRERVLQPLSIVIYQARTFWAGMNLQHHLLILRGAGFCSADHGYR